MTKHITKDYDLEKLSIATEAGRQALSQRPIKTVRLLSFPCFTLKQEEWGINALLWLAVDDFVFIDTADSDTLDEALIAIAYHQLNTKTPLFIDKETAQQFSTLPELANRLFIDETGVEMRLNSLLHNH